MALNNNLPYRRSIRLADYDYRQPGVYFITVCTQGRESRFGDIVNGRMRLNAAGRVVQAVWQDLPAHYPNLDIDAFIVMPDHFHGIVVIHPTVEALLAAPVVTSNANMPLPTNTPAHDDHGPGAASSAPTLGQMMRRFKSESAIAVNRGTTPGQPLWQRNYWERVLRDERECAAVRRYIRENPQRWQARAEAPA